LSMISLRRARPIETTGLTDVPADDARQRHYAGPSSIAVPPPRSDGSRDGSMSIF
jgi:hypothetical protein